MQKRNLGRCVTLVLAVAFFVGGPVDVVSATTSSSTSYEMTEAQFGAGSSLQSCSGQYCAKVSIGSVGDGSKVNAASTATFDSLLESSDPILEVIVEPGESDLGILSTDTTASKTMVVRIRNHLGGGYALQIVGSPPRFGDHTLSAPTAPTKATPGVEQFAINATANTTPHVGANLLQVPDGQGLFGEVAERYSVPDFFMYTSGDIVARSLTTSGRTDYTISMIVNISNATPAGHYAGDFAAVVVPVY